MIDELSPNLPPRLTNEVRIGLLRVESKQLEGAEPNSCLKEAYDVFAGALMKDGEALTEELLSEVIPGRVLRWARTHDWFARWLLHEDYESYGASGAVPAVLGDMKVPPIVRTQVLRLLASRIAHWKSVALENGANQVSKPIQTNAGLERIAPTPDSAKPTKPKHGPPPDPHSWTVAKVVVTYPGGWKDHLEDIGEELDRLKVPVPKEWAKWAKQGKCNRSPQKWAKACDIDSGRVVKVIEQRLKMAEKYTPPASSEL